MRISSCESCDEFEAEDNGGGLSNAAARALPASEVNPDTGKRVEAVAFCDLEATSGIGCIMGCTEGVGICEYDRGAIPGGE